MGKSDQGLGDRVPIAVKVAQTGFVVVLVPVYWSHYGPGNFLWFSDFALLTSVPALWLESPLLAGTQALAVVVLESAWAADFTLGLLLGGTPLKLAHYMFDRHIPLFVRALSLFHLWLPALLVYVVSRVGYDRRSLKYQWLITSALLVASWRLTKPDENINGVYSLPGRIHSRTGRTGFVLLLIAAIPLVLQLPVHLALKRLFPQPRHSVSTHA